MTAAHAKDVLVVDDNAADTALLQAVFKQLQLTHRLHVAADGLEALSFLHKEGKFAHAPRPAVILLDLNLPKLAGREVLSQVKQHDQLRTIPVMIFSSSSAEADIRDSYTRGANGYVVKPFQLDELVELIGTLVEFWLTHVSLPPSDQ
ncbi:MAG TPA: response regulator [Polyangiales bacterium]|nr:response regulator [Polyangiales bacterium]